MTTKWQTTPDDVLNAELVTELLEDIVDDVWVTAACAERVVNDSEVSQVLVKTGLRRSSRLMESIRGSLSAYDHIGDTGSPEDGPTEQLVSYFQNHERERKACILRRLLLDRQDRIQTYLLISSAWKSNGAEDEPEEDPWADPDEDITVPEEPRTPFTLAEFLTQPLVDSAIILASEQHFRALELLFNYHDSALFPYRFAILDAIPLHVHPSEYHHLLPANDFETNIEIHEAHTPWREKTDWVEEGDVINAIKTTASSGEAAWLEDLEPVEDEEFPRERHDELLSAEKLTEWYTSRVEAVDSQSGLLDNALALLQHGASQGIPRLDELGEDLILLDRLVYEAPQPSDPGMQTDWNLQRWRAMQPPAVIKAYLRHATYETIADNIRHLVLPYLSVLEAQAERAKQPDLELSSRLLYQFILEAPIDLVVAIFEHSKADVQRHYRIIKNDEDVARVAMAYLYGLNQVSDWPMLSRIFECQPDWGDDREDDDEAFATLTSLARFVTPSASRPRATASELLLFFKPLPASALSRLLDVLDAHLEGGEILSKWGVDTPLQWFLLSADDEAEQRAKVVRMSRRPLYQGTEIEDEATWRALLDDMLKLTSNGEGGVKAAFGRLKPAEVTKIYFTGLLSSGNFVVAKRIKGRGAATKYLTRSVVEDICLDVSRELYDNASSGNMHRGDMKLAYECLSVAEPTARIQKEREFIEATSKICSFHVYSRPGMLITPLEIRLTKDRLELVARVLSSTDDAYKHSDVILDLSQKLGFKGDTAAEVKILSMLVDVALQHEDFFAAESICERMMESSRGLVARRDTQTPKGEERLTSSSQEALDVAWRSCYQLGRQSEFSDINRKLRLLGFALELCPTANMLDVLAAWRKLESYDIEERKKRSAARSAAHSEGRRGRSAQAPAQRQSRAIAAAGSLLDGLTQGQDAAASVLNRVAANFPFSVRGRQGEEVERSRSPRERNFGELFGRHREDSPRLAEDVAAGARQAFARGMGWLIGDDG